MLSPFRGCQKIKHIATLDKKVGFVLFSNEQAIQLTLEQGGFELHESTYMWIQKTAFKWTKTVTHI